MCNGCKNINSKLLFHICWTRFFFAYVTYGQRLLISGLISLTFYPECIIFISPLTSTCFCCSHFFLIYFISWSAYCIILHVIFNYSYTNYSSRFLFVHFFNHSPNSSHIELLWSVYLPLLQSTKYHPLNSLRARYSVIIYFIPIVWILFQRFSPFHSIVLL